MLRLLPILSISASAYAFQLLAARELAVPFTSLSPILELMICLAQVAFGVGAFFAQKIPNPPRSRVAAMIGATAVASLAALLDLSPSQHSTLSTLCAGTALFTLYALLGFAYLHAFRTETNARGGSAALAIFWTIVGTAAGFIAADWGSVHWGVNVCWLILSLSFLAAAPPPTAWAAALPFVLAFWAAPLDQSLENLRPAQIDCNFRCSSDWLAHETHRIYGGWTPYSRLDIYSDADHTHLVGAYNYYSYWIWNSTEVLEDPGLRFINPRDKILMIGASAGFDAAMLPSDVDSGHATLIEIDPTVVGYFLRNPELNRRQFFRSSYAIMDGRAYLDQYRGLPFDAIIVGSMDSPSGDYFHASPLKAQLLTAEAVRSALSKLSENGTLLFTPRDEPTAANIMRILEELHLPWGVFWRIARPTQVSSASARAYSADRFLVEFDIYANRNRKQLQRYLNRLGRGMGDLEKDRAENQRSGVPQIGSHYHIYGWAVLTDQNLRKSLLSFGNGFMTDDRPYLLSLDPGFRPLGRAVLGATAAALIAIAFAILLAKGTRHAFFLLIGVGYMITQLLLLSRWRSCFDDPVKTTLVVFLLWSAGTAIGALLARGPGPRLKAALPVLTIVAAFTYWSFAHLPFDSFDFGAKLLLAAAMLAPVGIACGLLLPWGLSAIPSEAVGSAFLLDSLGAAGGYVLFQGLSILWGSSWNIPVAIAAYAAAIFCL